MRQILAAMAAVLLTLAAAACGHAESTPEAVTVTSTVAPSSAKSTTTSPSASSTTTAAAAVPATADAQPTGADCLVGSMGQPQFQGTSCLDKQVSSCGDPATMESGTTFFTDGSSGWTQQCANVMYPQQLQLQQTQTYAVPTAEVYEPQPTTTISYDEASPWVQDQIDWAACMENSPSQEC